MWREFLFKMGRTKRPSLSSSASDLESGDDTSDSDSSGNSGHYSFRTHQSDEASRRRAKRQVSSDTSIRTDGTDESTWREKFEFTLSLIGEPRYLLTETLVAEQLKLTLKQQAYRLELLLLRQTIDEHQQPNESSTLR